ncbi:MAG: 2Fe-2S iron-sulfur cluster-binding protein [Myxococcota bacterium]
MSDQQDKTAPGIRPRLSRLARRILDRFRPQPDPARPSVITFEGADPITVSPGATVLLAARAADVDLTHYCGGMASCGTCRVEVVSGAEHLSAPDGRETMVLGFESAQAGDRLGCQARIYGPVTIRIPRWF